MCLTGCEGYVKTENDYLQPAYVMASYIYLIFALFDYGYNQRMIIVQVIPTYNEALNVPVLVSALFAQGIPGLHILIVDDNSPDGTGAIAEDLTQNYPGAISVLHRPAKEGLGKAYIQGFRHALDQGADVIGMMDADLSHPPDCLPILLDKLSKADVAIGSRYIAGGSVDKDWPFWRKALSWFANTYARTILGLPIRDVTGGYRLWRRTALESIPFEKSRSNGYVFIVELAYMAKLAGLNFAEAPIYFAERTQGHSKMSLPIQLEAAFRVWQLRRLSKQKE